MCDSESKRRFTNTKSTSYSSDSSKIGRTKHSEGQSSTSSQRSTVEGTSSATGSSVDTQQSKAVGQPSGSQPHPKRGRKSAVPRLFQDSESTKSPEATSPSVKRKRIESSEESTSTTTKPSERTTKSSRGRLSKGTAERKEGSGAESSGSGPSEVEKGRKRKIKEEPVDTNISPPKAKKRLSDLTDHFPTVDLPTNRRLSRSLTRRLSSVTGDLSTAQPTDSQSHSSDKTGSEQSRSEGTTSSSHKSSSRRLSLNLGKHHNNNSESSRKESGSAAKATDSASVESEDLPTRPKATSSAVDLSSTNTGACLSSNTCVGRSLRGLGRTNSVCPQNSQPPAGSNPTNMASSSNNNSQPSNDADQAMSRLQESLASIDNMEMNRLQALLESRGISGQLFSALGPRMAGLISRQTSNPISGKIQGLLANMQAVGDESTQLQGAIEMCQILVMGNEETLGANFPIKATVQAFMHLLAMEHNFDIMNNACRALTYMMEALPRSTPVVADAIPLFLQKLQRIECMDVAEQALTALEMLSKRHSKQILNAGGVMACLTYVDFFSINAQRCALTIAANCFTHLNSDEFHYIVDCIPMLTQRLTMQASHSDKKSVENVCLCFTRLVDNFQLDEIKIRQIASHGLLQNIQQLLVLSPPVLGTNNFVAVIRMIHLMCASSPSLAVQLLKQNFALTVRYLLLGTNDPVSGDVELVARTPQELHEIVCLIGELMPRLPSVGLFSVDSLLRRSGPVNPDAVIWQWRDDRSVWRPYTAIDSRILEAAFQQREEEISLNILGQTYTVDFHSMSQVNEGSGNSRPIQRRIHPASAQSGFATAHQLKGNDERGDFLASDASVAENFVTQLFGVTYEVYSSSAGPAVRHECLRGMLRMLYNCSPEVVRKVLQNLSISSQIANMLSSQDLKIVVSAVQLVTILLEKVPELFGVYFRREGVFHQMEKLTQINVTSQSNTPQKNATTGAELDVSSRSLFGSIDAALGISRASNIGVPSESSIKPPWLVDRPAANLREDEVSANAGGGGEVLSSPASPTDESPNSEEETADMWTFGGEKIRSKGTSATSNQHPFMLLSSDSNTSGDQSNAADSSSTGASLAQKFLVAFDSESPFGPSKKVGNLRSSLEGLSSPAYTSAHTGSGTKIFQMDVPADLSSSVRPRIVVGGDIKPKEKKLKEPQGDVEVKSETPMDESNAEDDSPASNQSFGLLATDDGSNEGNSLKTGSKRKISSNSGSSRRSNNIAVKSSSLVEESSGVTTRRRSTNSQAHQLGSGELSDSAVANLSADYRHSTSALMDAKSYGDKLKGIKSSAGTGAASNETSARRRSSALNSHLSFDWWAAGAAGSVEDGTTGRMTRSRAAGMQHTLDPTGLKSGTTGKRTGPVSKANAVNPPLSPSVSTASGGKKTNVTAVKATTTRQERSGPGGIAAGFFSNLPLPRWGRPSPTASPADQPPVKTSNSAAGVKSSSHHHHHHSSTGGPQPTSVKYLSARSLPSGGSLTGSFGGGHPSLIYGGSGSAALLSGGAGSLGTGGASFYDRLAPMQAQYVIPPSFANTNSQSGVNKEKVRQWIKEQAKSISGTYCADDRKPGENSDVLARLTAIAEKLKSGDKSEVVKYLEDLRTVVTQSDVSPFEIHHSGLVDSLLTFLTSDDDFDTDNVGLGVNVVKSDGGELTKKRRLNRQKRLQLFCELFLNIKSSQTQRGSIEIDRLAIPALASLVSKLNACVTQVEQFPVKVHELPGGSSGSLRGTNALRFFHSHQIKCNLKRHPDCTNLRQWKRGPVKIDPLAQISAVERYLVLKGFGRVITSEEEDTTDDDGSDEDLEEALVGIMATLTGGASGQHKLQFLINDHPIPSNMTIYQAIRQFGFSSSGHETDGESEMSALGYAAIWVNTHNLHYRSMPEADGGNTGTLAASKDSVSPGSTQSGGGGPFGLFAGAVSAHNSIRKSINSAKSPSKSPKSDRLWNEGIPPEPRCPLSPFLTRKLPDTLLATGLDPSLDCLCLLRVLHAVNKFWWTMYKDKIVPSFDPIISNSEFFIMKLTAKATRQLQDPLVIMTGNLPGWLKQLAIACPFVFPFETRQLLFYVVVFDRDRALQRLMDTTPDLLGPSDTHERVTPRLERRKCTIQRDDLLKQAESIINDAGSSRALLEIQFKDEVGTGLGPTLEFYALVSRELQKADLELWRGDKIRIDGDDKVLLSEAPNPSAKEIISSKEGLYPIPLQHHPKTAVLTKLKTKYKFIGKLLARALMDFRMLDLPLSPAFYKWLLGDENSMTMADIQHVDRVMQKSLQDLMLYKLKNGKGQTVEDIELDFTLPGSNAFELKKSGKDTLVTTENLEQYIKLVTHWLLHEGVVKQMEAVREGFESVLPLHHLKMFYPEEMDYLFCGSVSGAEKWDKNVLLSCFKPDHGYHIDSSQIIWLVEILASYDGHLQRRFLQFVTGCPKLPVGGFKSLSPPLTVVRRNIENGDNPDKYLPSVMTCVNYLKLPEYGSPAAMRSKLEIAMREGQKSFHLS